MRAPVQPRSMRRGGPAAVAAGMLLLLLASSSSARPFAAHVSGGPRGESGWWHPPQHLTWYWQLQGTVKNSQPVAAYDIDAFANGASEVASLHGLGRHVICYVDVGTAENFRPDYHLFPKAVL